MDFDVIIGSPTSSPNLLREFRDIAYFPQVSWGYWKD